MNTARQATLMTIIYLEQNIFYLLFQSLVKVLREFLGSIPFHYKYLSVCYYKLITERPASLIKLSTKGIHRHCDAMQMNRERHFPIRPCQPKGNKLSNPQYNRSRYLTLVKRETLESTPTTPSVFFWWRSSWWMIFKQIFQIGTRCPALWSSGEVEA